MKTLKHILLFAFAICFINANAQEKKIKFSKGTLKICSSKNFQIEGYDGNEVIIENIHEKRNDNSNLVVVKGYGKINKLSKGNKTKDKVVVGYQTKTQKKKDTLVTGQYIFFNSDDDRKKGLKKIGKKSQNADLGIYLTIEQKEGELIFRDQNRVGLLISPNEKYLLKIPNSIKLNWKTSSCNSNQEKDTKSKSQFQRVFYNSNASTLTNFSGEVAIASTISNIKLVDVVGPAVINTIGGNVTIEFDKKLPKELYSIYTNNGFIDVQIPKKSNLLMNIIAKSVYSDVDFKVLEESVIDDVWQTTNRMKLKYGTGNVKMILNGGFGNVYLRQK